MADALAADSAAPTGANQLDMEVVGQLQLLSAMLDLLPLVCKGIATMANLPLDQDGEGGW
jgi:hypothetical protein